MQTRIRWICLLFSAVLILGIAGCGGGAGDTGDAGATPEGTETAAGGGGTPQPPEQEEMDIEPTGLSLGDNVLDASITADNQLPPKAFGTWTSLDLVVKTTDAQGNEIPRKTPLDSASISVGGKTLSITKDGTSVKWMNGQNQLSAYNPADYSDNPNQCFLMSSNLSSFFADGAGISYTTANGSGSNTLSTSVSLQLTISTDASCP